MRFVKLAVALALILASGGALAQTSAYPNKPIRMIVPFAPGGASDFVARISSQKLGEILGQQVVVDNRAGASGNIGLEAAGKAAPDGYTIFLGNIGTIAINAGVFKTMPIDTQRDLIAVTMVAEVPSILVVNPEVPVSNVAELVALARSKPGALNFASPGPASFDRLEMERFMRLANLKIVHIPYKGGAGPAVTGLLGGETHMMFVTLSSAMAFVQAGRLKALALSTANRIEALPNVPTLVEAGYPELVAASWQGVFVPAGTPRPIVDKLHAALLATFESPDVKQRLAVGGALVVTSKTPEEFAGFVGTEIARWGRAARESGATAD
jgi:tripartite-type tricarboxylate transporter receptor subunit TctC